MIEPARQIHTFGMRYAIDVCFCDRAGRVLHVVRGMRPRRVTKLVLRARLAVEMKAGSLRPLRPGDQLSLVDRSDLYPPS